MGYDFLFLVPVFYSDNGIEDDKIRSTNKEFQFAILRVVDELIKDFKLEVIKLPLPASEDDNMNNNLWVEYVAEKLFSKL